MRTREEINKYYRGYYAAHKNKINKKRQAQSKEACKKYYQTHKDKCRKINKKWYDTHRDERHAYNKKYNQDHKGNIKIQKQIYYSTNLCSIRERRKIQRRAKPKIYSAEHSYKNRCLL